MRLGAFFFAAALLVACSGGNGDSIAAPPGSSSGGTQTAAASTCEQGTASACTPAFHVASAADVIAASKAFDYQSISISKSAVLSVGDDLVADADLVIDAGDLSPAAGCDDCHAPLFRTRAFPHNREVAGITCLEAGQQPLRQFWACMKIAIAKGTTFRVRAVTEDLHPSAPTYWSFIDIVEPCSTSCGAGDVLCAATHTCYAAGYESCAFCEGASPAACACRGNDCRPQADGTKCSFASSPDVEESGVCHATGCLPRR